MHEREEVVETRGEERKIQYKEREE